ncbi:HugZ family pyridoxamine 5'-phosphate oxidase [Mameliella alba]|uniref:Putative heme iron utilization protein n=1 Tax=Mameliella alba TaxID=561184 RepID=A0A0B3RYW8_9RHOB|nr:pyridoxamine 5'-phosphate oxidase family protein [Mameliella alba]KHQ53297.1 putative heme iron utilization protein [Mameliella alba]
MTETNPFRTVDAEVRALARRLIEEASFAALAVTQPDTGTPSVTRIALTTDPDGAPLSLVSTLSAHTAALVANPACALLVGEPEDRGDPLTHPRLTLHVTAELVPRDAPGHAALRDHYLSQRPKAKLYIDFGDFHLLRFRVTDALMNGGFGKAYHLTASDLAPARSQRG